MILSSLYEEVYTTPKPGLVDVVDTGAHKDMDVHTFEKSARVITPYLTRMFQVGARSQCTPGQLLDQIRPIGMEAETAMLRETSGVNTHKGAIYSLGIVVTAVGYCLNMRLGSDIATVFDTVSEMTAEDSNKYFQTINQNTASSYGDFLYLRYGEKGVRGEAMLGYPLARKISLPMALHYQKIQLDKNIANINILLAIASQLCDTNILHRSSYNELEWFQWRAKAILDMGGAETACGMREIIKLNEECINRNISPGGAADYLILTIFLRKLCSEEGIFHCDYSCSSSMD